MARVPGPICTCSCCWPPYCAQLCMPSSFLPAGMPDFSDVPAPLRQWLSAADGATRNRPFSSYAPSLLPGNGGGVQVDATPPPPSPPPSPRWLALHTCILCMHEHPHISSFIRSRVSLNGQRGGGVASGYHTSPALPWLVERFFCAGALRHVVHSHALDMGLRLATAQSPGVRAAKCKRRRLQ